LAGIAVWFITKPEQLLERLTYSNQGLASLKQDQTTLNVDVVRVSNRGTKAARNVKAVIQYASNAEISQYQITSTAGPMSSLEQTLSADKHRLIFELPSIAPGEILSTSMIVKDLGESLPEVSVRSDDSIAAEEFTSTPTATRNSNISKTASLFTTFIALILQMLMMLYLLTRGRDSRRLLSTIFGGRNNTAFVLAHKGNATDAAELMRSLLVSRGGGPIELANYGFALGILGKKDESDAYFAAAKWGGTGAHERAVILFNQAALAAFLEQYPEAADNLREAARLNPRTITQYCALSDYIQDAIRKDAGLSKTVEEITSSK
jgi:tetratricopeptide (TPR) repeat protein